MRPKGKNGRLKNQGSWTIDQSHHRVFDILQGKSAASLEAFLLRLKGREQVRVVCIDMSSTYHALIRRYFPNARVVADRFHVSCALSCIASWSSSVPLVRTSNTRGPISRPFAAAPTGSPIEGGINSTRSSGVTPPSGRFTRCSSPLPPPHPSGVTPSSGRFTPKCTNSSICSAASTAPGISAGTLPVNSWPSLASSPRVASLRWPLSHHP